MFPYFYSFSIFSQCLAFVAGQRRNRPKVDTAIDEGQGEVQETVQTERPTTTLEAEDYDLFDDKEWIQEREQLMRMTEVGSKDSILKLQEVTKVVEEVKETGTKNASSTPSSTTPVPDSSSPVVTRVTERSITTTTTTTPTSVARPSQDRPCIRKMQDAKGECEKQLRSCNSHLDAALGVIKVKINFFFFLSLNFLKKCYKVEKF